jgi:hypothetical protein
VTATAYDAKAFFDGLVAAGLIVPAGVPGIFGRNRVFEDVLARFDAAIARLADADGAELFVYPPVIDRKVFEAVDYMDSFPHLAGTVHSFFGKELEAKKLSEKIHAGETWGDAMKLTDVTLNPAACYPVLALLESLGLPAKSDVATDPFFGKGGKMLAASQRELKLKFEVLVPVISVEQPTACCSFNYHESKFADAFGIDTPDGRRAHTACLGFGLERCVMALFQTHGFDPGAWPSAVRATLWP